MQIQATKCHVGDKVQHRRLNGNVAKLAAISEISSIIYDAEAVTWTRELLCGEVFATCMMSD